MNYFYKNRFVFWVLIILVVINIAALATFFICSKSPATPACCPPEEKQCNAFRDELGLSGNQTAVVDSINKKYMEAAEPIALSIKETRTLMLNELENEQPDTIRLNTLTDQLAVLQMKIQKENIKQYMALKRVCTPEQAQRLSALYRDLYGCVMQDDKMQRRYRHGQGNNKSNCE